uniref:G-protein coupled receptors family 1 profile domain-containing protein n=1 Tax=Denticeps clupeoides TaxID=299321 RepID=A0AAY4EXN2_9TELE
MSNDTCSAQHFRYPLFTATYSLVLVVGLPLNAVSLWTFFCRQRLKSVPVVYMANLAVSDMLFILSLPLRIAYFSMRRWPFGDLACMIPGTLFSVNLYSSSFFITFISVDRMLAVVYPLRSRSLRSLPIAWMVCLAVWLIIAGLSVPVALNHKANNDSNCSVIRCFENYSPDEWQRGFIILCFTTVVGILIPFVIILGCTIAMVRKLREEKTCSLSSSKSSIKTPLNKSKLVRLFQTNLFIYALCFIPFHVSFILYGLHKMKVLQYNFFDVQTVTMCLASTNSCLDPLIYYFSSKNRLYMCSHTNARTSWL